MICPYVPTALGMHILSSPGAVSRRGEKVKKNSGRSLASSRWRTLRFGALILLVVIPSISSKPAFAQTTRKVKVSVEAEYPELAKKNNIHGTARVQIVVAPDGNVKDVRVLGGNPVLTQAAVEAAKKWKYEPAPNETTAILKFEFKPQSD